MNYHIIYVQNVHCGLTHMPAVACGSFHRVVSGFYSSSAALTVLPFQVTSFIVKLPKSTDFGFSCSL